MLIVCTALITHWRKVEPMLQNLLFFTLSGILAASWFAAPTLLAARSRPVRILLVIALHIVVLGSILLLEGGRSLAAMAELSLTLAVIGKLLAVNFTQVQSANYPKHRRCY